MLEHVDQAAATSGELAIETAENIRRLLGRLREGLVQPGGQYMNEIIRLLAGEVEVLADGSWRPKKPAAPSSDRAASQTRSIAGARFGPCLTALREVFNSLAA